MPREVSYNYNYNNNNNNNNFLKSEMYFVHLFPSLCGKFLEIWSKRDDRYHS
jgi:hypothetical protein